MAEQGELQGPLDLTVLMSLIPGQRVAYVGRSDVVMNDLAHRSAKVTRFDTIGAVRESRTEFHHVLIPEWHEPLDDAGIRSVCGCAALGRSVLIGLDGPRRWRVRRTAASLRATGFEQVRIYGAHPALSSVTTLVPLRPGPTRTFARDIQLPYSAGAAAARRAMVALAALGVRGVLFPSAVIIATRAS